MSKPDGFTSFMIFVVWIFLTPVFALFNGWACSHLWEMLIAPQYGAGPSYRTWFGVATLLGFLTLHLARADREQSSSWVLLTTAVLRAFSVLVALGIVHFICMVLGWS